MLRNSSKKIVLCENKNARLYFASADQVPGIPADAVFETQLGNGLTRWKTQPSIIEDLKKKTEKTWDLEHLLVKSL
jgi:hypothetical protein